jgi:dipeptide transport system substrate-binding protein
VSSFARVIASKPSARFEGLHFNCARAPFTDRRVRQAVSYAFDRKSYVKTVWGGLARADANVWPREYESYLAGSDQKYATFDPERARSLLSAAGFTSSRPLEMEIINASGAQTMRQASLILQDAMGKIGHKVKLVDLEQSVWFDRFVNKADFDAAASPWGMRGPDPAGNLNSQSMSPTNNLNRWNPPGYAALVTAANSETDPKKRIALHRRIQQTYLTEMPFLVLCHAPALSATRTNVKGWTIGPAGYFDGWNKVAIT